MVKRKDDAVRQFGELDIVRSNAGVASFEHVRHVTKDALVLRGERVDRVFSLNNRGLFFIAREASRHVHHGGRIIFLSSNTARDLRRAPVAMIESTA
ncbi:hypothetical protein E4U42_003887 [Claviceps africana]|uniref:Uncharacterized protein n=1 Tax=Claviceps africana TaxID=83212 RepID=A0A8K0NIH7_9HYPO|nr:hypothetical protein E4U42_003887 [Claviceps africana]